MRDSEDVCFIDGCSAHPAKHVDLSAFDTDSLGQERDVLGKVEPRCSVNTVDLVSSIFLVHAVYVLLHEMLNHHCSLQKHSYRHDRQGGLL